jgi:hypothetical protein
MRPKRSTMQVEERAWNSNFIPPNASCRANCLKFAFGRCSVQISAGRVV